MFTLNADGKREYTLKKVVSGEVAKSAHPARFSPDDRYSRYDSSTPPTPSCSTWKSKKQAHIGTRAGGFLEFGTKLMRHYRHRVTIKKRYGLLITQQKDKVALGAN